MASAPSFTDQLASGSEYPSIRVRAPSSVPCGTSISIRASITIRASRFVAEPITIPIGPLGWIIRISVATGSFCRSP